MLGFLRQYGRMLKGAGAIGRAGKLERRGRLAEARASLLEALDAVDGISAGILVPATSSTRLFAITRLASIAAILKDLAEAKRYAKEGLALWSESRLAAPKTRDVRFFSEWESWARAFLTRAPADQVSASMKMEFIASGAADCPLIRLYGHDGEVVRALTQAVESVRGGPIAMNGVPGIEAVGGVHLTATMADRDRGVRRVGDLAFEWAMSREGWAQVVELLNAFESAAAEGRFQYLSREGEITVLISRDGRW